MIQYKKSIILIVGISDVETVIAEMSDFGDKSQI